MVEQWQTMPAGSSGATASLGVYHRERAGPHDFWAVGVYVRITGPPSILIRDF